MIKYGENIIDGIAERLGSFIVTTMEVPWNLVKDRMGGTPLKCVFVETMERSKLEELRKTLPQSDAVVGIGGGASIDTAKYIAWKSGARLVTIPTIISADVVVTKEVGVRDGGKVHYIGNKPADEILVDYSIIRDAPKELNRAGAEDILSIYTALFDWRLASERGLERFDEGIAKEAEACLHRLEKNANEIWEVTETGIKTLMELYLKETELCQRFGSSRPEEGSEHFFAYNLEYLTRKHYLHGPIIGLGIFLMSCLQDNRQDGIAGLMDKIGLEYRPGRINVAHSEIKETLATLKKYVKEDKLPFTVIDEADLSDNAINNLYRQLTYHSNRRKEKVGDWNGRGNI